MAKRWALAVQGGGARGVYAAGVLDVLNEKGLMADCVFGTSAGALIGANYVSKDVGRSFSLLTEAMNSLKFANPAFFLSKDSFFDFHWLFEEAPLLFPFNLPEFINSSTDFYACFTDLQTGKASYINKRDMHFFDGLAASCSMPLYARKPVNVNGVPGLDGGVVEAFPIHKALSDNYEKLVIISTRVAGYKKTAGKHELSRLETDIISKRYKAYPEFLSSYLKTIESYGYAVDEISSLVKENKAFLISPSVPPSVSHVERNKGKLRNLYEEGRKDTLAIIDKLIEYLS